jgi:ATP phosphoribosyltransferase regulatory subunit
MYRFFDREGRTLALRADFTTQVARIAASKLSQQPIPLRCFYIGSVFRHEEPQAGRLREFTQAGVELIGAGTAAADAEVVALAVAVLEALGLGEFQLNLGQMALFRALTEDLAPDILERVLRAVDQRNQARLGTALDAAGVSGQRRGLLGRLPSLVGGPEVLEEACSFGGHVAESARSLLQVYRLLESYGVAGRIVLDLGEVRGMDYYTGITFRGLVPGLGWPVLSGGRYDDLIGQFGRNKPAVGFGMGLERVLLAQTQQGHVPAPSVPDLIVRECGHSACLRLVRRLRAVGCRVEVDVLGREGADLTDYASYRGAGRLLQCCGSGETWMLKHGMAECILGADELLEEVKQWGP